MTRIAEGTNFRESCEQISSKRATADDDLVVMFLDASRAHFHPPIQRKLSVELPPEDREDGADLVGELERAMYGTRDASTSWERFCTEVLESSGAASGDCCSCLFYNATAGVQT